MSENHIKIQVTWSTIAYHLPVSHNKPYLVAVYLLCFDTLLITLVLVIIMCKLKVVLKFPFFNRIQGYNQDTYQVILLRGKEGKRGREKGGGDKKKEKTVWEQGKFVFPSFPLLHTWLFP